ncbi:MAG: cytochrome c [Candidatus Thiodiazotropha taylori]
MKKSKHIGRSAFLLIAAIAISSANAENSDSNLATLYLAKACAGCHGVDGRTPTTPYYPIIAGQNEAYIYNQLRDFKDGSRSNSMSTVMTGIMSAVSEQEIRFISAWLSKQ